MLSSLRFLFEKACVVPLEQLKMYTISKGLIKQSPATNTNAEVQKNVQECDATMNQKKL